MPDELDRERVILIDTTIKMWGRPRLFAIATALACARNNKLNAAVHGYALGGKHVTPADLSSKEGIIQVMGQLDASLHCGKALSDTMKNVRGGEGDEYFLVTEESNIHTEAFHKAVAELKNPLSFLLTVDRNGQLHFYEFIKGRRKLLSTAKFDLEDILEEKKPLRKEHLREVQDLPAIMKLHHFPLYLPTSKLYFHDTRIAITDIGIIAVTMDHRLLYWPERSKGAIELMEYIERAWYCFGHSGKDDLYVLCYHNGMGKNPILHNINLSRRTIRSTAMEGDFHHVEDAEFDDGNFRIMVKNEFYVVDPRTATAAVSAVPMRAKIHRPGTNMNSVKKFVNNGYTVINTVRTMHLNRDGQITLESRYLKADHQSIRLVQCHRDSSKITARLSPGVHGFVSIGHENKHVKFFRFVWKDGSIALFDSRGLLHLRSSDPSIPEITIVTVMEKSLACWASNGDVCGSKYFTGGPEDWFTSRKHISVMAFYNQYIQPFIDTLR